MKIKTLISFFLLCFGLYGQDNEGKILVVTNNSNYRSYYGFQRNFNFLQDNGFELDFRYTRQLWSRRQDSSYRCIISVRTSGYCTDRRTNYLRDYEYGGSFDTEVILYNSEGRRTDLSDGYGSTRNRRMRSYCENEAKRRSLTNAFSYSKKDRMLQIVQEQCLDD